MFGLFKKKEKRELKECYFCGFKSYNLNTTNTFKLICDCCESLYNYEDGKLILSMFQYDGLNRKDFLKLKKKIFKKETTDDLKQIKAETKKNLLQIKKIKAKYKIKD